MNQYYTKLTFFMLIAMLLWGGGWTALKILTEVATLEVVIFWRFFIMFLAFFPILFVLKSSLKVSKKSLVFIFASSVLNILFMVFAFLGVHYGQAGSGGVIITTLSPLFTVVFVNIFFKKPFAKKELIGLAIGVFGGLIMLGIFTEQNMLQVFSTGNFYYLLAALVWAVVTLLSQKSHLHIHPVIYSFYISGVATVILLFLTMHQDLGMIFDQDLSFWVSLLYLAVLGQTVATTIYFYASGKLGSAKASSFMFV
ncbi:MAG: DMT family transporter, partial [Thiovulaceae bacterium]|nr:DMT family transporter [Sulfurimonadaceae bacterium]